ncbi:dual specificity protein phosphatase [Klebsormidium nitens]|uniref:Dual specificity protein phosphatase n=1 Tax=Klebsormidium nitens TaxID=105231 RepID=A0A1Y1HPI8_KLENI|nr:dual specificity protein phosphatase [Klebsormidium nitens]|eukprot:GAQ78497.1 dual specificity protein phosphatase [Klebsormidium nitens]
MRKRERENPCFVCGHYHKYDEGEPCGICGHRAVDPSERGERQSAFSAEILPSFLYLGSYDNASRAEILKAQGISHILNTVAACQNLYKNSFTYHTLKEGDALDFDECFEFIESARREEKKILVHCMSGANRSPSLVIAYLMRHKGWRLPESYQWVKDRKPGVNISPAMAGQLQNYEVKVHGPVQTPLLSSPTGGVSFGFGFPSFSPPQAPATLSFSTSPAQQGSPLSFGVPAGGPFVFGAGQQSSPGADRMDSS